MVRTTDSPGVLRIRLAAIQRELAIDDLREWHSVLTEAVAMHDGLKDHEPIESTRERLEAVRQTLDQVAGSEPGKPFELRAPTWIVDGVVRGAAAYAVDLVAQAADELRDNPLSSPAALRRHLKVADAWTKSVFAYHDRDPGPR